MSIRDGRTISTYNDPHVDSQWQQAAALLECRMSWRQAEGAARDLIEAGWRKSSVATKGFEPGASVEYERDGETFRGTVVDSGPVVPLKDSHVAVVGSHDNHAPGSSISYLYAGSLRLAGES